MSGFFKNVQRPRTEKKSVVQPFGGSNVQALNARDPEHLSLAKSKRCEAILVTNLHAYAKPGNQCAAKATYEFDGHPCCWVHYQAATTGPRAGSRQVQNRHYRIPAVEFVERKAAP